MYVSVLQLLTEFIHRGHHLTVTSISITVFWYSSQDKQDILNSGLINNPIMPYTKIWQSHLSINNPENLGAPFLHGLVEIYKGTRSHNMKLIKPQFESELRKHAFSQRIIDDWNSLSENILASESLEMFKGRLDKHWSTKWFKISTE